jgi:hypothetical protein
LGLGFRDVSSVIQSNLAHSFATRHVADDGLGRNRRDCDCGYRFLATAVKVAADLRLSSAMLVNELTVYELKRISADNLKKCGWSLGWVSAVDVEGRTIWIVDAHRDGKRFVVRADEMLTAFIELESVIHRATAL